MSTLIAAFDAKQKLSELLNRTASGEEFVITRHGKPMAKLLPVDGEGDRRAARAALLAGLRAQPALGLERIPRDEAYADEP
ncbi:MAG: type II toxin-antitoxin system prevent-host-death family antitoxin [Terricaulis sp.]